MCATLLSYFIVGAMEISPGVMQVNYIDRGPTVTDPAGYVVRTTHMELNDYLDCWGNGYK